jgi:hypothetical protein
VAEQAPADQSPEKPASSMEELKKEEDEEDGNIVIVCGLRIDIEKITDQEMYALRKVLPRKEYR